MAATNDLSSCIDKFTNRLDKVIAQETVTGAHLIVAVEQENIFIKVQ